MKSLKLLYWFHGHKCPMSTIGFKAGVLAKKLLQLKRNDYRNSYAKVYFKSCALDGIQIGFPATFGNSNLELVNENKMIFEFENIKKNLRIRLSFKKILTDRIDKYISIRDKNGGVYKTEQKRLYKELYSFVVKSKPEELFEVTILK